ncbi:MAG: HDOD domain-containing protein [Deltaproteobacteria bacterium]|nr:HDOD domain-containing protein [Deltaproteobacteria bacterium]
MWAGLIAFLMIVGLLAYILLFRKGTGRPKALRRTEHPRPPEGRPTTNFRKTPAPETVSPMQHAGSGASGYPPLDLAIPDLSQELKIRLREGVDFIFSVKVEMGFTAPPPLRLEELAPDLLRLVRQQIRDLKNFRITHELCRALDNPDSNMTDLAKVIVTDPVLSGKILKVANSAYFGLPQKVNSIGQALMIIGLYHVKNMLYREGLAKLFDRGGATEAEMEGLWEHAVLTSICAGFIQDIFPGLDKGTVFTLGLLHDIGKFILPHLPPNRPETSPTNEIPFSTGSRKLEEETYGLNHALIGRLAFEEWGFSELMKSVVELHHAPHFMEIETLHLDGERLKYLLVLFLADQVAKLLTGAADQRVPVATLAKSYYPIVDPGRVLRLVQDNALFSEVKKSRALMESYSAPA